MVPLLAVVADVVSLDIKEISTLRLPLLLHIGSHLHVFSPRLVAGPCFRPTSFRFHAFFLRSGGLHMSVFLFSLSSYLTNTIT
jgi:hypothetical protein